MCFKCGAGKAMCECPDSKKHSFLPLGMVKTGKYPASVWEGHKKIEERRDKDFIVKMVEKAKGEESSKKSL